MKQFFSYRVEETVPLQDGSGHAVFFTRDELRPPQRRRFNERDLYELTLLAIYRVGMGTASPQSWPAIAARMSRVRRASYYKRRRDPFLDLAREVLPDWSEPELAELFDANRRRTHERRVSLVREEARPGPVSFDIVGREHLDRALGEGRGAILWTEPFAFQTVTGKRGLAEAGYRLHQLSAAIHGFSHSHFGERVTNRALLAAEDRFLASRLAFAGSDARVALGRALRCMKAGDPVFFSNNSHSGRRLLQLPFCGGYRISMVQTPIRLALTHGLPLLSVSTVETEPFGRYRIRVTEDLARDLRGDGSAAALAEVARRARDAMLAEARAWPDQFIGWEVITATEIVSGGTGTEAQPTLG